MNLLEISHLKKSFENLDVLHDISLSVKEGEVVAIIGPSGSGKSTLLRCATMLERMDEGELTYLGKCAATSKAGGHAVYASPKELKEIQGYFGLVFQNFNLFPHYSVLKNIIDAPVHVQKRDKEEAIKEARILLKKMGLEDKENYYPCQLSGGQKQRAAIAAAVASQKELLVFDEPTSGLDYFHMMEAAEKIRYLSSLGKTIFLITHDPELITACCNFFLLFERGKIQWSGGATTEKREKLRDFFAAEEQ